MKCVRKASVFLLTACLLAASLTGCGVSPKKVNSTANSSGSSSSAQSTDFGSDLSGTDSGTGSTQTGNAGTTGKSGAASSTKTQSAAVKEAAKKIPGYNTIINSKNYNLGGRTVNIGKWYGFQDGSGTDETNKRQKAINEKIEQMFNCKLNFVEVKSGSDPSLKASILSGKPKVDFLAVQGIGTFYDLYSSGCLMPLDNLTSLNIKDSSRFHLSDMTQFNGKYYGVGQNVYGWLNRNFNNVLLCNFDLTAQAGHPASQIYGWQTSGQWNWSNFEKVAKDVAKISGKYGMSDLDQNKMYGFDLSYEMYNSMLLSNNTDWIVRSGNGFTFNGGSASAMKVLSKYAEWANPNTGFIKFTKTAYDDFQNGKTAFLANIYPLPIIATWASGSYHTGTLYFPKGPDAKNYVSKAYESLFVVIPKGVSNVSAIGAVANAFCTPLYTSSESRAMCQNDVMKTAKVSQSVTTMMNIYDNSSASQYPTSLYGIAADLGVSSTSKPGWFDYVRKVAQGEMTAQQAVDTFKSRCNSVLASTYN